jgi:ddrB-like ParB superfamily domain
VADFTPPPVSSLQPEAPFTPPPLSSLRPPTAEQPASLSGVTEVMGDQAKRAVGAAWETLSSIPGMVFHPFNTASKAFNYTSDAIGRVRAATSAGDKKEAALSALGAIPLAGPAAEQIAREVDQGKYAEAIGHAAALRILSEAQGGLAKIPYSEIPGAVGDAAKAARPVVEAALKAGGPDVAMGAGKVAAGAALDKMGAPYHVGAVLGLREGAPQIGRGLVAGVKAGREAVAAARIDYLQRLRENAPGAAPAPGEPTPQPQAAPPAPPVDTGAGFEAYLRNKRLAHEAAKAAAANPEAAAPAQEAPSEPVVPAAAPPAAPEPAAPPVAEAAAPATPAAAPNSITAPSPFPSKLITTDQLAQYANEQGISIDDAEQSLNGTGVYSISRPDINRMLHAIVRDHDTLSTIAKNSYGVKSMKELSSEQMLELADRLKQDQSGPEPARPATRAQAFAQQQKPPAAPAAEPTDLEAQLQASIAQAQTRKGVPNAATTQIQAGNPETPAAVDTGPAGARETLSQPVRAGGQATRIDVPGEARSYAGRYEVRELADIQPSHNGSTFQPNPKYRLRNDRNYDDPLNQQKVVDWSVPGPGGFKPANLINDVPDSSSGPPVIDSHGDVLGGNGRTMIMQRVNADNFKGAAQYRKMLADKAANYGIDPAAISKMKEPVLVRTIDDAEFKALGSKQAAITDFNKKGTAELTPSERAIADSRRVSPSTLDDLSKRLDDKGPDSTLAQALEGSGGTEVLDNLIKDGVVSPQERAAFQDSGGLTDAGKKRISGLMTGRFFGNAKQMDTLPDAMRNKMERIAAPLARVEGLAGFNLSPVMQKALNLIEDANAHGLTLDDQLKQGGLFAADKYPPEAVALAEQLKTRDPLKLTNAVRRYAEAAKYATEYQGPGMFQEFPAPRTRAQAFADSFGPKALTEESGAKKVRLNAAAK